MVMITNKMTMITFPRTEVEVIIENVIKISVILTTIAMRAAKITKI